MADERNVIEIILKARDETAAAFAEFAAKLGLAKTAAEDLKRENAGLKQSFDDLGRQTNLQTGQLRDLRTEMGKRREYLIDDIKVSKDLASATVAVERATDQMVKTERDHNATLAQKQEAIARVDAATAKLSATIRKEIKDTQDLDAETKKLADTQADQHAKETRQFNERKANRSADLRDARAVHAESMKIIGEEDAERAKADLAERKRDEAASAARLSVSRRAIKAYNDEQKAVAELEREKAAADRAASVRDQRAAAARLAVSQRAIKSYNDEQKASKARADAEVSDVRRVSAEMSNYEKSIRNAAQARNDLIKQKSLTELEKMRLDVDFKGALIQAEIAKREIGKLVGHIDANIDLDDTRFMEHIPAILAAKEFLGRDVNINLDVGAATAKLAALNVEKKQLGDTKDIQGLSGLFGALGGAISNASGNVAGFDNVIRGAATFAIAGFLQPLIVLAGAAAGALLALGSAAIYAGGALAGGLVAGLAQAIPVLGVVALAVYRLTAVFQAASQAQLQQQQASYKGAAAHQSAAKAANTYQNSIDRVATAERALSKARLQARRDLQDMVLAEKAAENQAKASSLAQRDAQAALANAIATGGDVQQAQLGVQQANVGRAQAGLALTRSRQDLATGRAQGVAGAPGVVAAAQALDQAKRGTDLAGNAADLAANKITAATGKLNFMLGRLSPAERQLFGIVQRFQDVARKAAEDITQPIIKATGTVLEKLIGMFKNPAIMGAMTGLAGEMAKQGIKIFDAFTDKKSIGVFLGFIKEAKTNLGPLTDILINVGKIFLSIAQAASPVLSGLLGFFDQATGKWAKFLDTPKGKAKLGDFFKEGMTALTAFLNLGGAIVKLFLAIAGPGSGAKTGIDLLVGATGGINKLADNINKGGDAAKFLHDMFKITKEVIKELGPLFTSIGSELGKTFSQKGVSAVHAFVDIFAKILVPALGTFIRNIGGATAAIGGFIDQHPALAKMAATFLGFIATGVIVWKTLGLIVGPIKTIVGFAQPIADVLGSMLGIEGAGAAISEALSALVWPVAITVGIALLLQKFGLLQPLIDDFKKGFDDVVKIAGPPFRDLIKQVERLWDAFSKGKGAFAIIRPILAFFVNQVLARAIKALAAVFGNTLAGAFKIIAGLIGLITDLLTFKFARAWNDVKKIFSGMAQIATAAISGFLAAFGELPKKVLHFFVSMINSVLHFLGIESPSKKFLDIGISLVNGLINGIKGIGGKVLGVITSGFTVVFNFFHNLPGKLKDLAGKAIDALVGVFGGVGEKIITAVISGGVSAFNFAGQLVKTIAKVIDKAIPDSIHMPDPLPNIDLPNNPLKDLGFYAQGGPVPGYGGGDRVPALLEAGEHVFTKDEVRAAGGHIALLALRRALGGGGQGTGGRYQAGGNVAQGIAKPGGMASLLGDVQIDIAQGVKQVTKFSDEFRSVWRVMWNVVRRDANVGSVAIVERFKELNNDVTKLVDKLTNHITFQFDWSKNRAVNDAKQMVNQVGQSVSNLENVVFKGMSYIGNTTNDALKSFSAKPVQLSIEAPSKAEGGWIGNPGERGRDMIATLLGRGEAVLNWGHQRLVDPALRAAYGFGLDEMFDRTSGLHAGSGGVGFAKGGFSHYDRLIKAANKVSSANFPYVYGGGHQQPSQFGPFDCSGAVSYVTQQAGYKVPTTVSGNMGNWGFPAGPNGATIFYNPVHTFMRIGSRYFGTSGFARPGGGAGWFDQTPGASYLSGFKEIHLPNLGADAPFMLASGMDGVQRVIIKGVGVLKDLAQKAVDKARGAANDLIGQRESALMPGMGQFGDTGRAVFGGGSPVAARKWTAEAMKLAGVSGPLWMNMLLRQESRESSFDPNSINRTDINAQMGDPSIGILQTIGATFRSYMLPGHGNIRNPVDNIIAAIRYMISRYGGGSSDRAAQVMWDRGGGAYARGGFVGSYDVGGEIPGGMGQPVPILAHAREWVVNPSQQSKIASWLGTSRDRLKGALGFSGGPTSFAGGGEIAGLPVPKGADILKSSNLTNLLGVIRMVPDIFTLIGGINKGITKFASGMKNVGNFLKGIDELVNPDTGLFAKLSDAIDAQTARMTTGLTLAQSGLRRLSTGAIRRRTRGPEGVVAAAQQALKDQNTTIDQLNKEAAQAVGDLSRVNKEIKDIDRKKHPQQYERLLGQRNALWKVIDDTDAKIATADADRLTKAQDLFQSQVTQALGRSTRTLSLADVRSRIGQTLGNTDAVAAASDLQIKALQDQQKILQQKYNSASAHARRDPRWQSVADDLLNQLRDATTSIVEAQAAALQNQIDVVNNQASRAQASVDIRNRLADLQEKMGDPVGAAQARLGNMQATGAALGTQVAGLNSALAVARQEKNNTLIDSLNDQIADLNTQIAENTAAMSDQTVAVRQATLDQIQNRTTFQTGALGGLGSLLQTIATNLTTDTSSQQTTILQKTGEVLQQGFDQLAQQLFGGFGVNVQGTSGMSFVQAVSQINFDQIEAGMTQAQKGQFEGLVQALIDAQNAIAQNTGQLQDLNGTLGKAQSFSSTAWQWFRMAVFTGSGDLMPQFQVPSMQSGGYVRKAGLFNLHAGEFVVNPSHPSQRGLGAGDINVTVHEAGPETDYTYLSNRIAFATRTPSP